MAKVTHVFCTLCNPSNQVRDEGHEIKTGYAEMKGDTMLGFVVPPGWAIGTQDDTHVCPSCLSDNPKAAKVIEERGAPEGVQGEDRWPAHSSPFGAR